MTPLTYRKKPVEIQAIKYDGTNADEIIEFGFQAGIRPKEPGSFTLVVPTLEGTHEIEPGYFVIRGVKGEFYGCDPDIFALTYDEVTS